MKRTLFIAVFTVNMLNCMEQEQSQIPARSAISVAPVLPFTKIVSTNHLSVAQNAAQKPILSYDDSTKSLIVHEEEVINIPLGQYIFNNIGKPCFKAASLKTDSRGSDYLTILMAHTVLRYRKENSTFKLYDQFRKYYFQYLAISDDEQHVLVHDVGPDGCFLKIIYNGEPVYSCDVGIWGATCYRGCFSPDFQKFAVLIDAQGFICAKWCIYTKDAQGYVRVGYTTDKVEFIGSRLKDEQGRWYDATTGIRDEAHEEAMKNVHLFHVR